MLQELQVTQPRGEPSRRWFRDERFDLIVWFEGDQILGFQLCYDRAGRERAVTWLPASGYSHDRIDSDGDRPGLHPTRILLPEPLNSFPHAELTLLEGAAAGLEPALREFVLSKLRAYRQSEPISLGGSLHVEPTEGILTPEDIDASRRHAAAMTDEQLAKLYVDGPEKWPEPNREDKQMISTHLFRGKPCRVINDHWGFFSRNGAAHFDCTVQFENGQKARVNMGEVHPLKEENPVATVFWKLLERLINTDRNITEWVHSLTADEQDQLALVLGCWWEIIKLWERVFIMEVSEPGYGLSDYPRLVSTMLERGIHHSHPLEQGPAIRKWLDGISEADRSSMNKEASDWWNTLRLDQRAVACRLHWNKMGA